MENRKGKLSIEQLVTVGDWLHDTDSCFLLISKNENAENKHDTLACMIGDSNVLSDMLYSSMLKDKNFYQLVTETVLRMANDNLEELLKNK